MSQDSEMVHTRIREQVVSHVEQQLWERVRSPIIRNRPSLSLYQLLYLSLSYIWTHMSETVRNQVQDDWQLKKKRNKHSRTRTHA